MRLTFSFKTTARIVRLFEIINDPRFILAMIAVQVVLAVAFWMAEWKWTGASFALLSNIDAVRYLRIKLSKQRNARRRS